MRIYTLLDKSFCKALRSAAIFLLAGLAVLQTSAIISAYYRSIGAIDISSLSVAEGRSVVQDFISGGGSVTKLFGWRNCVVTLNKAVSWRDGDHRTRYLLGTVLWWTGEYEQAHKALMQGRRSEAKADRLTLLLAGIAKYQQDRQEEAWETWARLPDLDTILVDLGYRFHKKGDRSRMYEFWEGAERLNSTPKPEKAHMYRLQCNTHFNYQRWDRALYWCRQSAIAQSSMAADLMLAHVLVETGEVTRAEELVGNVLRSNQLLNDGLRGRIFWIKGRLAIEKEKWSEGLSYFAQATSLLPKDPNLYLQYALAFIKMGKSSDATTMLLEAERLDNPGILANVIDNLRRELN